MPDPSAPEPKQQVHTLDMTPELHDAAIGDGFPPFQAARQGGTQTIKRGSMNRPDGRCNTISILRDANYSTGIHELAQTGLCAS